MSAGGEIEDGLLDSGFPGLGIVICVEDDEQRYYYVPLGNNTSEKHLVVDGDPDVPAVVLAKIGKKQKAAGD